MRRLETVRQRSQAAVLGLVGNIVPILLLAAHDIADPSAPFLVGTVVALAAPLLVPAAPPRYQLVSYVLSYAGIVGLTLMQWGHGGVTSPYAILLVLPMIWFGLTGTDREIKVVLGLIAACCLVPMIVLPEHYPREFGMAVALVTILASVNLSIALLTRETARLTARLQDAATRDQLTGLLNRRGWEDTATNVFSRLPAGATASVALIDLDGLKRLNDTMGHDEGDRELRATGARLGSAFVDEPAVCRLGGDEFAVLAVGSTADQLLARLEEVRRSTPESGAFSAGIAVAGPGESLRDAMRRADLALYEVKTTGRGRTALAYPAMSVDGD